MLHHLRRDHVHNDPLGRDRVSRRGEHGRPPGASGSMIRHAIFVPASVHPPPVGPLSILMIEAASRTLLMAAVDPPHADSTRRCGARQRAVDVPTVAAPADHETMIAARALAVPQRIVHVAPGVDRLTLDMTALTWQKSGPGWLRGRVLPSSLSMRERGGSGAANTRVPAHPTSVPLVPPRKPNVNRRRCRWAYRPGREGLGLPVQVYAVSGAQRQRDVG